MRVATRYRSRSWPRSTPDQPPSPREDTMAEYEASRAESPVNTSVVSPGWWTKPASPTPPTTVPVPTTPTAPDVAQSVPEAMEEEVVEPISPTSPVSPAAAALVRPGWWTKQEGVENIGSNVEAELEPKTTYKDSVPAQDDPMPAEEEPGPFDPKSTVRDGVENIGREYGALVRTVSFGLQNSASTVVESTTTVVESTTTVVEAPLQVVAPQEILDTAKTLQAQDLAETSTGTLLEMSHDSWGLAFQNSGQGIQEVGAFLTELGATNPLQRMSAAYVATEPLAKMQDQVQSAAAAVGEGVSPRTLSFGMFANEKPSESVTGPVDWCSGCASRSRS